MNVSVLYACIFSYLTKEVSEILLASNWLLELNLDLLLQTNMAGFLKLHKSVMINNKNNERNQTRKTVEVIGNCLYLCKDRFNIITVVEVL